MEEIIKLIAAIVIFFGVIAYDTIKNKPKNNSTFRG
jgi:hypothetical protein